MDAEGSITGGQVRIGKSTEEFSRLICGVIDLTCSTCKIRNNQETVAASIQQRESGKDSTAGVVVDDNLRQRAIGAQLAAPSGGFAMQGREQERSGRSVRQCHAG